MCLSRFRSKKEQTETLEKLKNGQVDILIGTHRVLSKDVVFADLGLMIIDEEQRFGVKHKETFERTEKTSRCPDLDSNANSSLPFTCLCWESEICLLLKLRRLIVIQCKPMF